METAKLPSHQFLVDLVKQESVSAACKYLLKLPECRVEYTTLFKDISRLFQRFQYLNKSKTRVKGKENLDRFLNEQYRFPDSCSKDDACRSSCPQSKTSFLNEDNPVLQAAVYKTVTEKLAAEVSELREKQNSMEEELTLIVNEKDDLNESVDELSKTLGEKSKNLKRTANREAYWREKCIKLDNSGDNERIQTMHNEIKQLRDELKLKDTEIKNMKSKIKDLNAQNEQLQALDAVEFFDNDSNTYIPELHACVYSLLDHQVSCENVSNVIMDVCTLLNKQPNKLPTVRTINNWSIERSIISRRQLADTSNSENTTLHTDEASKYGQKWGAFATRDAEGNYLLLGLRDMATKSSRDTLDTFKEILSDIDVVSKTENDVSAQILSNIKNTMSDRASTETKFNELLREYREEILPTVHKNYENMTIESQQAISRMNNFFCGLHTLVHMADVCQKSLCEIEKDFFDGAVPINNANFTKQGQSGTVRTIFTSCKAFARRGDQKNGCHQAFKTYVSEFLKENNMLSLPLQPLRGNRFNILFSNAGQVFFFQNKMIEYLQKTSNTNGLLQSVLHDLQIPFFISGCKALGLISKFVTTPLWRVIENKDVSISKMNQKYLQLLNFLKDSSENIENFIRGELMLFPEVPIKHDKTLEKLLQPSETDGNVVVILSVLLPALAKLIQHQYGDHLPGGVNEVIDESITRSVDKHNKFPERVFSLVDHILSAKPNISTLALEAQITFSLNNTNEWLNRQDNMNEIILESRKEALKERKRFQHRAKIILVKQIEKQEEDFKKKEQQERNRVEKLEKITSEMLYFGLWQNHEQVETELGEISSFKEKEKALKSQLRFRKDVFKQVSTKNDVYAFSKIVNGKRQPLSIDELKENVKTLICQSFDTPPEKQHLLVGKSINHRWIVEDEPKWYSGKVISQVPSFPSWFNVKYDDDPAVYTSKLGEEYQEGDVIIKQ